MRVHKSCLSIREYRSKYLTSTSCSYEVGTHSYTITPPSGPTLVSCASLQNSISDTRPFLPRVFAVKNWSKILQSDWLNYHMTSIQFNQSMCSLGNRAVILKEVKLNMADDSTLAMLTDNSTTFSTLDSSQSQSNSSRGLDVTR